MYSSISLLKHAEFQDDLCPWFKEFCRTNMDVGTDCRGKLSLDRKSNTVPTTACELM